MKRVLVTGGLGYVGARIAKALSQYPGFSVRIGTRTQKDMAADWLERCELAVMDFESADSMDRACDGVDHIIHCAALNEIVSAQDPALALQVNGVGSLNLLLAAERASVERFVYFSTAHVYGAPLVGTITEECLPRPVHPYAITHRTAEDFVLAALDRSACLGIVFRLSNGFGAPAWSEVERWTLVVNDLCRQAVEQQKLVLHSSGLQMRDFITLTDVVRAVEHVLVLPEQACGNGLFNLGGEMSLRIIDVATRIAQRCERVLGYRPPIVRPEPGPDEKSEALDYQMNKLKGTGYQLQGDIDAEIDATLRLCHEAFGGRG